jgi:hypothetical protein
MEGRLPEARWAEVYDELRSHQSLASVVNDPGRGKGIFKAPKGIGDLWDKVREGVEEIHDQREAAQADVKGPSDVAGVDIGPIPELVDFQSYLDTFADLWDVYARNIKPRGGIPIGGSQTSLGNDEAEAHRSVPHEYFQSEFKLEHHQIFRQSLQTSIERAEEINDELTGHLDMVEVSLFEHIRRAQRDQLFDSLARLGEPLQEDLRTTLGVVTALRGQLRSVQKKQLRCGMAVGRLARRKRRVSEVLQRLDCLGHVQQSQPSIQILLQGQDYVTALELLESTKAALDSDLKGLVSIKPGTSRLAGLGQTFDRGIEADFVHSSTEAILGSSAAASSAKATNGRGEDEEDGKEQELHGAERLRRLCWCLGRRELLKSALSSTLRDVLLSQMKKDLRTRSQALLEESRQSDTSTRERSQEGPSSSPREEGNTPAAGSNEQPSAAGITAALCSLSFDSFLSFWMRIIKSCVDIARRFSNYAALVQSSTSSSSCSATEVQSAATSSSRSSRGEVEVSSELLRLFEVIMNLLLQKTGVFLQARQGEHQNLKVPDWQRLLQFTNASLDTVRGLHECTRQKLLPQDAAPSSDDVGRGLRALLYSQTKIIIEEFHQRHLAQVTEILEQERWERTDVPEPYKRFLEQLVGRSAVQVTEVTPNVSDAAGVDRSLQVDHLNFLVVPAGLTLIQLLGDYVQLCRDLEAMPAEILQKMAVLLREFNQKTQRLVLRGEAVQKQNLKRITASNLALCSQSCGLLATILPKMQAHLLEIFQEQGGQSSGKSQIGLPVLLSDLSKIAGEYDDHRNLLFGKLSDLLSERFEFHAKKCPTPWLSSPHQEIGPEVLSWASGRAAASGAEALHQHEALEGLVKDITSMYKVLLRNLTGESVKKIFAKAFSEIAQKFEQRLTQDAGNGMSAPSPPYLEQAGCTLGDRLTMDLAYLQEQLSKLSGIATPLQHLLCDLVHHLRTKLGAEEPLKKLHPTVLEALQRSRGLPA